VTDRVISKWKRKCARDLVSNFYGIVGYGKNHTVSENVISPRIEDAVLCILGEERVSKINPIPLSNNAVSGIIQDV
jgi:hypothetical protein